MPGGLYAREDGGARRFVTPTSRFVTPTSRLVTPACSSRHLPPDGRHVYRRAAVSLPPCRGKFAARRAVSNESAGKSDGVRMQE